MRLYIDSADRVAIQQALSTGYAAGVTTNPTLLRRAGLRRADLPEFVRAVADADAAEIHLQVLTASVEGMISDGRWLHGLDPARVLVKVPATLDGFTAASRLAAAGVGITVTAVYAARQVVLAEGVGARYAAVYMGRLRDAGQDPLAVITAMLEVTRAQHMTVRLLVASLRTPEDVEALAALGAPCATLPVDLFMALPNMAATAEAARVFEDDASHL
ncbi:MAG: transaldolase family protein [Gemmatimonadales bacterium]